MSLKNRVKTLNRRSRAAVRRLLTTTTTTNSPVREPSPPPPSPSPPLSPAPQVQEPIPAALAPTASAENGANVEIWFDLVPAHLNEEVHARFWYYWNNWELVRERAAERVPELPRGRSPAPRAGERYEPGPDDSTIGTILE
jgi:hypothetical protein